MLKKILKDSVVYTIATVLAKGIQFLLLPIYTRLLEPKEYGLNDILVVYSAFATVVVSLEILQAIARFYPEQKTQAEKMQISSAGFFFMLRNYLIFAIVSQFFANPIAVILTGSTESAMTVRYAMIAVLSNGIFSYLQAQLRWDFRSVDYSIASILFVFISTGSSIVFIAGLGMGGGGVFAGQIAGALIGGIFCFFRNRSAFSYKARKGKLREMLLFSSPFVLSSIMVIGAQFADRLVLQGALDYTRLGIYGIAAKFSSIVGLLFIGFNMAISPHIYANTNSKELPKEIASIFSIFLPLAALVAAGSFIFSHEIIVLMTSEAYHSAAPVMPILVLSSIIANMYLLTPGMSITKNTVPIIFISALSCLSGFSFNFLLIPPFGLYGAAFSNLLVSIISFSAYYVMSQHYFRVLYDARRMPLNLAIIGLVWVATYLVEKIVIESVLTILLKIILLMVAFVLIWLLNPSLRKIFLLITKRSIT